MKPVLLVTGGSRGIGAAIARQVDIDRLLAVAADGSALTVTPANIE